ncbi:MAG: proton-conducting transporter membrane subunit [Gemmatimonadaceae bacterium]
MSLLLVPLIPLLAVALSAVAPGRRGAPSVTLASGLAVLVLAGVDALRVVAAGSLTGIPGWMGLDGLGAVVLLLVAFVSATAALSSWGYLAAHGYDPRRVRRYCVHFNLFVFALVLVPVLSEPALVWMAVEFTAMFSVLLVAFDATPEALEAAWKYLALMFMGAAIALLGFFLLFQAQQLAGGGHYTWEGLRVLAPRLHPALVTAAFFLILVGFGVKTGFVPMHTWLPDAHSQAPSPVCALLSGVKTTVVLYTILRLVPLFPAGRLDVWMQMVGLVSVGTAAFLLLQVRDYKRLFAYSTVEHMGIIFVAAGFGGLDGMSAAMLQMVSHSLTKSFCFLAAGAVLLLFGTRDIGSVRGLIRTSPFVGTALLFGALAIGGAPPMAVFLSEFSIFRAGLAQGQWLVIALLAVFIAVAFVGILLHINGMVFGEPARGSARVRTSLPFACGLALVLGAVPVLVLGVYQPPALHTLVSLAAARLAPVPWP